MVSLDELNTQVKPTLDQLSLGKDVTAPVVNQASNLNLATYSAALSPVPEKALDTYREINADLSLSSRSELSTKLIEESKAAAVKSDQASLVEILASPEYSDEQKQAAAANALDVESARYEFRNMLSTQAVTASSGDEEPRAEMQRVDVGSIVEGVNSYKRDTQALLNAELAKENPGVVAAVGDFAEIIVPFAEGKMVGEVLAGLRGDQTERAAAMALLGSAKMDIRGILEKTPPAERLEVTKSVISMINEASYIVMPDGNDLARRDFLQTVLDSGTYGEGSLWIDNIISVLDMTVIGGVLGRTAKAGLQGTKVGEAAGEFVSNVTKRSVKTRVQPTTVSQNYKDTNPAKAKAAHEAASLDMSGEAAEALYGTNRTDAIANDVLPEILNADGSVVAKINDIEKPSTVPGYDPDLHEFVNRTGSYHLFEVEKAQARATAVNRFESVVGLKPRKEMFQVGNTGDGMKIRAVYGPAEGGFSTMEDAVKMASWALRGTGAGPESIKLLRRQGPDYVEIPKEEYDAILFDKVVAENISGASMSVSVKRKSSDILVAIDHEYTISPGDIAQMAEADVKYNIFDRVGLLTGKAGQGSFQRTAMDAASMLHPNITIGGSNAIDRAAGVEKVLLESARKFTDEYDKLDNATKVVVGDIIKEANLMSKEHTYAELVAAGLRDKEIASIKAWREYWDKAYYLENADAAKTLRARGFMEYIDEVSDTRLFAKPIPIQQAAKITKVYNPASGEIGKLDEFARKALYDGNGTAARLRQPLVIGDEAVEHIVVSNTMGGNYLRAISESTQVLNYRKGYYTVRYTDPYFVIEKVKNSAGELLYERAIATAGSRKDAQALSDSKAANEGKVADDDYYVREDMKKSDMDNDSWDLQQVRGRSAQRVRGKRLEDSDTNIQDPSQAPIMDPVESMVASARSVANRVSTRDMIEATKKRFISQYEEYLPTGDFGQKRMPNSVSEVAYTGGGPKDAKKLGDARTTYEYIRSLEDGYVNSIDDSYKAVLKGIADMAGNAGLGRADKAARWMAEGRGPSAMGKNLAFNLYLASAPLRQLIVQGHQAIQLAAVHTKYVTSGRAVPEFLVLVSKQLGMEVAPAFLKGASMTAQEAEAMYQQFRKTGQVAAIDKQNLVRGSLLNAADNMTLGKTFAGKAWEVATLPLKWSRQIGFDAGEYATTATSWLAHRDEALRAGKDMSNTAIQAEVAGKARNFTYNMNAAGDMPYNQNTLAVIFQFMQVPHKAILGMTTNRVLSPSDKLRLASFNALMFTLPPAAMIAWFGEEGADILPENQEARSLMLQGLEGYTLNKLLSMTTGEKSTIDFSSLSPLDMYGLYEFVHGLATTDLGAIVASTPSGQLFFGNNPRLTNFAKTTARYFNVVDDYEDPVTYGQVMNEAGMLFSGYSAAFKSAAALEYNRKYGSLGGNTNSSVSTPNAIAMAFGFQSLEDAQNRFVSDATYKTNKTLEADVAAWYRDLKRHILSQDPGASQSEYAGRALSEAWRVWGNDNIAARKMVDKLIKKDIANKDSRMYDTIIKQSQIRGYEETKGMIRNIPFESEEKRQRALDAVDYIHNIKGE